MFLNIFNIFLFSFLFIYGQSSIAELRYHLGINYTRINSIDLENNSTSVILSQPVPELGILWTYRGQKVEMSFEADYRYLQFLPDTFQEIEHDEYSTVFAETSLKLKKNNDLVGLHYGLDDLFYFYHNYSRTGTVTNIKLLKAQFIKLSTTRTGFMNNSDFEVAVIHFFLNKNDENVELKENYGLQMSLNLKTKAKKIIRFQYQIRRDLFLYEDNLVHQLRLGFLF